MVLDGAREENNQHRDILTAELETMGIRLNRRPPDIYFKKYMNTLGYSLTHSITHSLIDLKLTALLFTLC
jgi:hypothetical protein